MSGKIIEVRCGVGHREMFLAGLDEANATLLDTSYASLDERLMTTRLFVENEHVQMVVDIIQKKLSAEPKLLILITSVDAQIGGDEARLLEVDIDHTVATREELFSTISKATECDFNFLLLAFLATIVATIGIAEDNVAVVIAAMVIAPLLGPNLGLALGAALGDRELVKKALVTNIAGLCITVSLAALLALVWPPNLESNELILRTNIGQGTVVLALAAGVAAVQSLVSKVDSLLVGVMVAVALVPPATVLGMMIGIQNWALAIQAGLLLTINVASVNCAAQLVFLFHGIRPRTWLAQRDAKQSTWVSIAFWIAMLTTSSILALAL